MCEKIKKYNFRLAKAQSGVYTPLTSHFGGRQAKRQGSSVVEQRTHKPLVGCSNHLPAIMGAVVTKTKW